MYNNFFHFSEQPFSIAPDPQFLFMSIRHQEGLAHLLYGLNSAGGFVALTGEVGTGKTTLCHCLLEQLPGDIDLALILNPKLNTIELLATICDELGIDYGSSAPTLKKLTDMLNQHLLSAHANGRRTVLLIDEAQNLSLDVLEQIRLLTNLETTKTKLLQIILVGQPELKQLLHKQELRQLNQRITARYHLLPLSLEETGAYIRHRLAVCSGNPELFDTRAIKKVFQFSAGIPRIINILCDRALLGAYSSGKNFVTAKIVNHAAKESIDQAVSKNKPPRMETLLSLILLGCVVIGVYITGFNKEKINNEPKKLIDNVTSITKKVESPVKDQHIGLAQTPLRVATPINTNSEKTFSAWIIASGLTLNDALVDLSALWGIEHSVSQLSNCNNLQASSLNCLLGKATWKELIALNRPVILELQPKSGDKRYAIMTGIRNAKGLVLLHDGKEFPLADVLDVWNGYYLILWKSPKPNMKMIYPNQISDYVIWLREKLQTFDGFSETAGNPRLFDEKLKQRLLRFQHQQHLQEDGIAGAQTIIYLDNVGGSADSPHLTTAD